MSDHDEQVSALRAVAHPVRLRILSMLTAEPMSAAEVARALDLTHANASYHLRVLHDAGELVVEGEQKIRGGVAKRYRYRAGVDAKRPAHRPTAEDYIAYARALNVEVVRRLARKAAGPMSDSDLETWVSPETWQRAVHGLADVMMMLHEEAQAPRSEGAIPVSATVLAFQMTDDA